MAVTTSYGPQSEKLSPLPSALPSAPVPFDLLYVIIYQENTLYVSHAGFEALNVICECGQEECILRHIILNYPLSGGLAHPSIDI